MNTLFLHAGTAALALSLAAQASAEPIRAATYNLSLNRNAPGQMAADLRNQDVAGALGAPVTLQQRRQQLATVAEIIKLANPDVLLLNEFDYSYGGNPAQDLALFNSSFLATQRSAITNRGGNDPLPGSNAAAQNYQYQFIAPTNTGVHSGKDLNNNGVIVSTPLAPGYGDDAFGFGEYEGRFGMAFLSKYAIDTANVRTFQTFLWKDMPGNRIPQPFYSPDEVDILRLSSKSHWDIPVLIDGITVHFLASHPTPPVFDGPEDRNGTRNADEIRFWLDYVSGQGSYIYDDQGRRGGLAPGSLFVIMGDQNNDPNDGDGFRSQIRALLDSPLTNDSTICTPSAEGGFEARLQGGPTGANALHVGNPRLDTADFNDAPNASGNLRTDYVIPAVSNRLECTGAGIFWPAAADPNSPLVGGFGFYPTSLGNGYPSSDHKLVFVDLQVVPAPAAVLLFGIGAGAVALGRRRRRS